MFTSLTFLFLAELFHASEVNSTIYIVKEL